MLIIMVRETKALCGRCINITREILLEAGDFLEAMARFNSVVLKSFVRERFRTGVTKVEVGFRRGNFRI